jgi:hypothetical protein
VKTKESALREMLLELALAADPTANRSGKDDKQQRDVPRAAVPVSPSLESPVQLSVQRPPIQDPKYEPVNNRELSSALSTLGEMISDEHVGEFYKEVIKLYTEFTGEELA